MTEYLSGDGFLVLMGWVGLVVFWASALTVLGDAWQQARGLLRRRWAWGGSVRQARVVRGDGPEGTLATYRLEQVGHARDASRRTIDVFDRGREATLHGGSLKLAEHERQLPIPADASVAIWFDSAAFEREGAAGGPDFQELHRAALGPHGVVRRIGLELREGDRVWVAGIGPEAREPGHAVLATRDPRYWTARRLGGVVLFASVHLAICAAITWACVSGSMEDLTVRLAAGAALLHFLIAPPVLKVVRESVVAPDRAQRYWRWVEPAHGVTSCSSSR